MFKKSTVKLVNRCGNVWLFIAQLHVTAHQSNQLSIIFSMKLNFILSFTLINDSHRASREWGANIGWLCRHINTIESWRWQWFWCCFSRCCKLFVFLFLTISFNFFVFFRWKFLIVFLYVNENIRKKHFCQM